MNKAIFFDRDGTINVDKEYIHRVEDFEFERRAIEGLKILQNLGCQLIIVTGQSGIGRGYYSEEDYHKFMDYMYSQLRRHNIIINGEYFCPHHPEKGIGEYKVDCDCRKPKTGMLEQAVKEFDIDLKESWVIGDKTDDIEMGRRAGCKTILVNTGKAGKDGNYSVTPDYEADNLEGAAKIIKNGTKNKNTARA